MSLASLEFLRILTYASLRWYRDHYDEMLDDSITNTPTIRLTYAILNAEIARRIVR